MKAENAIEVNNITKNFKVFLDRSDDAKSFFLHRGRRKYENRNVIKGISFDVKKGEAIGLIGRNGCGKSTTLKMLTRIMYPDSGEIEIKGRVSSLIELGAGFHPDMSGRENIYINASIFGLSKKEIDSRIDSIIDFSELEDYIDNPVRTYSSGMYMRLAFSVAINVDADVLLIDEILAVGDANFQDKCFRKMKEIKDKGTTIVLVSHSMGQIESICDRSIWIENGLIKAEGEPRSVHREYMQYMSGERKQKSDKKIETKNDKIEEVTPLNADLEKKNSVIEKIDDGVLEREGNHKVIIQKVRVLNADFQEVGQFNVGDDIIIEADYKVREPVHDAYFAIDVIRDFDLIYCFASNTNFNPNKPVNIEKDGKVRVRLKNIQLAEHPYFIDFILKEKNTEPIDIIRHAITFDVIPSIRFGGVTHIDNEWEWDLEK